MTSNYVSLVREAITRLKDKEPNSKVYRQQCEAMVQEFVHIQKNLPTLSRDANNESAPIFKALFRVTCEAERLLERYCCEHRWLQAVVLTDNNDPKWSIFEIIREELNWCFRILVENIDSSTVERLPQTDRKGMFESDQKNLREQLQGLAFRTDHEKLMAGLLLASLANSGHVVVDDSADFVSIHRIEGRVLGGRRVVDGPVMVGLNWAGIWVAKKAFKSAPKQKKREKIRSICSAEVSIMANLNHPNVVRFIGCTSEDGQGPAIIMECEEKSLEKYLDELGEEDREGQQRMSQTPRGGRRRAGLLLDLDVAVDILTQIASGMAYLHSQDIAHLDLKPSNVLVTSSTEHEFLRVKITDFGLSIRVVAGSKTSHPLPNPGTKFYRAPELFGTGRVVCMKAADVCSFGFTCWAILHCDEPRLAILQPSTCLDILQCTEPKLEHEAQLYCQELVSGRRREIESWVPSPLRKLIRRCWDTNPDIRPPFTEIYYFLQWYKGRLLGSLMPLVLFQNRTGQQSRIHRISKATKELAARSFRSCLQKSSHSRQGVQLDEQQDDSSV